MNSKTVARAVNYDPTKEEVFPDNPKGPSFSFETIHIYLASQMRIKELIITMLLSSFTPTMARQSGKPGMVHAVKVDIL